MEEYFENLTILIEGILIYDSLSSLIWSCVALKTWNWKYDIVSGASAIHTFENNFIMKSLNV